MSFKKTLICGMCDIEVPLQSTSFPDELFDVIFKHQLPQLVWFCSDCCHKKPLIKGIYKSQNASQLDAAAVSLTIISSTNHLCNEPISSPTTNSSSSTIKLVDSTNSSSLPTEKSSGAINPVTLLKEILKNEIKISDEAKKESRRIVCLFFKGLLQRLKETDDDFKLMYVNSHYTGSSFEGLRIKDPYEYDIDLILKFPFDDFQVEKGDEPSYVKYKLIGDWKSKINQKLGVSADKKFGDTFITDDYLMPAKVRNWMQKIIAKAELSKLDLPGIEVSTSASGPAKTFKLTVACKEISIDVVPVIKFSGDTLPKGIQQSVFEVFKIPKASRSWLLVPKECPSNKLSLIECGRMWQVHFPEAENEIIHNRGCVKPIIKLLKLLRDHENWKILASYYLKTVVMSVVKKDPSADAWKEDKMFTKLLEAMDSLEESVKKGSLEHVLIPNCNLLWKMNNDHCMNVSSRLVRIITAIKKDPTRLTEFFVAK